MNYSKALINLNPRLRHRLHTIANLAEMTELQALELIVQASKILVDSGQRPESTEDPNR